MRVIDPGHKYHLRSLDTPGEGFQILTFVKREGPGYPGNVGAHSGTTSQEVLRALLERADYVEGQIHDEANDWVRDHLRRALWHLEERAARRHGRTFDVPLGGIEKLPTCDLCNHVGCPGSCRD